MGDARVRPYPPRNEMKRTLTLALLGLLLIAPALWASKTEKEAKKLDKELRKISLTASDLDGRRVVNRVMAKQLGVSRKQLVKERRETQFLYGQIFGTHEVARLSGRTFDQFAKQMKDQHRSLLEISEQHQVDLKELLADAKKLTKSIDKELDRVASGEEDEQADDSADSYDPSDDSLSADTSGFSPAELAQAKNQVHQPPGLALGRRGASGAGRGVGGGISTGSGGSGGGRGRGPH